MNVNFLIFFIVTTNFKISMHSWSFLCEKAKIKKYNSSKKELCEITQNDVKRPEKRFRKNVVCAHALTDTRARDFRSKWLFWTFHIILSDFTKFFLRGSILLNFCFLTEEASWMHRVFKVWSRDKTIFKFKFV